MENTIHIIMGLILLIILVRLDFIEKSAKKDKERMDNALNQLTKRRIINDNSECTRNSR